MNQKDIQFINRWEKHRGAAGVIKYLTRSFLLGLIASPLVLTLLNPNIWKQLKESDWGRAFVPVAFLCLIFSILPAIAGGLAMWAKDNHRYKLLTTTDNRIKIIENNNEQRKDSMWNKMILNSIFPAVLIAVVSFVSMLGYNAPPYYSYPFICCCALLVFRIIYKLRQAFFEEKYNGAIMVAGIMKLLFVVLSSLVVLSLLNLFFKITI